MKNKQHIERLRTAKFNMFERLARVLNLAVNIVSFYVLISFSERLIGFLYKLLTRTLQTFASGNNIYKITSSKNPTKVMLSVHEK